MKVIFNDRLKHVDLTFAVGDLFDAEVAAIVNSEQTDFLLSSDLRTISGQILRRYGRLVQRELNEATRGRKLRAGSVVATSGGKDFTRIFHAGFHEPEDWPGMPGGSHEADYLAAIGSCIRQILDSVRRQRLRSVAFPLIGGGRFGLNNKMLVLQFLDAVESIDNLINEHERLSIWLVIRGHAQFESVTAALFELLMRARRDAIVLKIDRTNVPIIDRFSEQLAKPSNEEWVKWQLYRLTEIALEIMCAALAQARIPAQSPEMLFSKGWAPGFKQFRQHALKLATLPIDLDFWGAKCFRDVLRNAATTTALETINGQRNNFAHGRMSLPLAEVKKLVVQGLQLDTWKMIFETDGELRLSDWRPWIATSSEVDERLGLFERWQGNCVRYLVPETGQVFEEQV
jgi:O-acetyl-ADP-ribose deacetylase (regulator of RNase III)